MIPIKSTLNRSINYLAKIHCQELKGEILNSIDLHSTATKKPYLNDEQNKFLTDHLDDILMASPNQLLLLGIASHAKGLWPLKPTAKKKKTKNSRPRKSKNVLEFIFDYDKFTSKKRKLYNGYDLAKALRVNVCPYCNLNYTHTVSNARTNYVRPDFDHFYPRSKYPLLALSFYNLIPCCSICNSRLKGNIDFSIKPHLHPYVDDLAHIVSFNSHPSSYNAVYGIDDHNLTIDVDILPTANQSDIVKLKNSIETFKLQDRYNLYVDHASEIMAKHYHTSGTYLQNLKDTFRSANFSNEELYRIAFGNYHETVGLDKRPLAKLTADIVNGLNFDLPFDE